MRLALLTTNFELKLGLGPFLCYINSTWEQLQLGGLLLRSSLPASALFGKGAFNHFGVSSLKSSIQGHSSEEGQRELNYSESCIQSTPIKTSCNCPSLPSRGASPSPGRPPPPRPSPVSRNWNCVADREVPAEWNKLRVPSTFPPVMIWLPKSMNWIHLLLFVNWFLYYTQNQLSQKSFVRKNYSQESEFSQHYFLCFQQAFLPSRKCYFEVVLTLAIPVMVTCSSVKTLAELDKYGFQVNAAIEHNVWNPFLQLRARKDGFLYTTS